MNIIFTNNLSLFDNYTYRILFMLGENTFLLNFIILLCSLAIMVSVISFFQKQIDPNGVNCAENPPVIYAIFVSIFVAFTMQYSIINIQKNTQLAKYDKYSFTIKEINFDLSEISLSIIDTQSQVTEQMRVHCSKQNCESMITRFIAHHKLLNKIEDSYSLTKTPLLSFVNFGHILILTDSNGSQIAGRAASYSNETYFYFPYRDMKSNKQIYFQIKGNSFNAKTIAFNNEGLIKEFGNYTINKKNIGTPDDAALLASLKHPSEFIESKDVIITVKDYHNYPAIIKTLKSKFKNKIIIKQ